MKRFVYAAFLLSCGVFASAFAQAQPEVKQPVELKVFIAPMEGPDANLLQSIRAMLIKDFEKHGISVTEDKENADAILSGSDLMQSNFPTSLGHHPTIRIRGSMRLVNKNGVALWAADVSSSRYAINESSSFVDKVTEKVAGALAEESKRKSNEPTVQRIEEAH